MRNKHIKSIIGVAFVGLLLSGCSDILNETPRANYTPDYFKTSEGVQGGITSLYGHLRNIWGNGYWLDACETGTDEYTWAQSADGNFKDLDLDGSGNLTPTSSRSDVLWNNTFSDINTASGIIENGSAAGVDSSLVAEAYFFRGFDYFMLTQTFGGVPLDLGSGELKFNTTAVRVSKRNTVPEVYTKCVFPDLLKAINDLPEKPRVTGGATKTAARLFLSKAYLTYAWWLENPNKIDTYPTCDRTDPAGHDAAYYYQQAYNIALAGIQNPGSYALQKTFYDVNVGSNDRNSEMVLYADHIESSEYYDDNSHSYGSASSPSNFAAWMVTCNYTNVRSNTAANWGGTAVSSVQREAAQSYGRPWTRMAPTVNGIVNNFPDKTYDSRYDGTFVTCYRGNWNRAGRTEATLYNANGLPIVQNDSVLSFLPYPNSNINYTNTTYASNIGGGILPGRADFVVDVNGISRLLYPGLWKIGTYRTDNNGGMGQPNGSITRPYPIAKFSELYLLAAEAAVKGATIQSGYSARELVNVLRARAGVWTFSNSSNKAKVADYSQVLTDATPQTITIDYILAERSREYYGEGQRWWDLVRTQTWGDYAKTYQICGSATGDHTLKSYSRNIKTYMYLRPIPQGQIDALQMSDADKAAYQNPGY